MLNIEQFNYHGMMTLLLTCAHRNKMSALTLSTNRDSLMAFLHRSSDMIWNMLLNVPNTLHMAPVDELNFTAVTERCAGRPGSLRDAGFIPKLRSSQRVHLPTPPHPNGLFPLAKPEVWRKSLKKPQL